jgi:restriction system protein
MAEITQRRSGELVRGVFELLSHEPEGLPVREIMGQLQNRVPPTEFEKRDYPKRPGTRRYEKIVRFSTIAAVKAGWLTKTKGVWTLTDEGRRALEKFKDPQEFYRESGRLYRKWEADQPEELDEASSAAVAATNLEEAEEAAWSEIDAYLGEMAPYDFQQLVAGLLGGMGYYVEWVSPPGPDGGFDVIAHTDPLGIKGPRIKVQVKRRADKITVDGLRAFMALLSDSDIGIFVARSGFTRDAENEARRQESRRIMMIDSERLFDLWTEHYERIPETERRLLPLRKVYYLEPDK